MQRTSQRQNIQPQVGKKLIKLVDGFLHNNHLLDFYGYFDRGDDCYVVESVTLTGQTINIGELFSNRDMMDFSAYCDRHLPDGAALEEDVRNEAYVQQHEVAA
ncbi:hypothetical protein [Herbaspirillum sp. RV1423]|uniref:hypothetical protein n=1 Tax=Herbaspirillum sp. RV1423 TaxID=1443993 RepID=UPI0004B62555|nr:hypothetical protein [Herbaspirillum sp. RV1423]